MFVAVVDQHQHPLIPTTLARARRWLTRGTATAFWKGGIWCVRLNREPSSREPQASLVDIGPGSQRAGSNLTSAAPTSLTIQARRAGVQEGEKRSVLQRRTHRTPGRQSKKNLPLATKARWQWKQRVAHFLYLLSPVNILVGENMRAPTRPGTRRWNRSFLPLEVDKHRFYQQIRALAPVKRLLGYDTRAVRDQLGLTKTSKKLAKVWEAHCVAAWYLLDSASGGNVAADNQHLAISAPLIWHRRQLHCLPPSCGCRRKPYGGTLSRGITQETPLRHPTWGKATVGGTLSLHDPHTNRRLTDANSERRGLLAHHVVTLENAAGASGTEPRIPRPKKRGRASPDVKSAGSPHVEFDDSV